jgi:hypothetical protein
MTGPSSGVIPMLVFSDSPFRMAQAEQPFPRWSVTMLVSSNAGPDALHDASRKFSVLDAIDDVEVGADHRNFSKEMPQFRTRTFMSA